MTIIVTYSISHLLIYISGSEQNEILTQLPTSFFPLLTGVLIGAVGIFLGSLGNLYGIIITRGDVQLKDRNKVVKLIGDTVNEVKQNTLFVLLSFGGVLLLKLLYRVDIPFLSWPLAHPMFSKQVVFDSLILAISILSFLAIYDCVLSMFTLHRHYEGTLKDG